MKVKPTTNLSSSLLLALTAFSLLAVAPAESAEIGRSQQIFRTDEPLHKLTLRGLSRVFVEVSGIHRDFAKFGLESEALKTQIESALGTHGLEIASQEQLLSDPAVARLRIKINANENQYRFYHYGVKLELAQKIPLNKQGGYIAETTWTSGQTGVIMPMDLRRLGVYAQDLVSVFLKDYHAQNPKVAGLK